MIHKFWLHSLHNSTLNFNQILFILLHLFVCSFEHVMSTWLYIRHLIKGHIMWLHMAHMVTMAHVLKLWIIPLKSPPSHSQTKNKSKNSLTIHIHKFKQWIFFFQVGKTFNKHHIAFIFGLIMSFKNSIIKTSVGNMFDHFNKFIDCIFINPPQCKQLPKNRVSGLHFNVIIWKIKMQI